jgi:hypothetical protein
MTVGIADRHSRSTVFARAGDTLALVSLVWPLVVAVALELALRFAPWLDPQVNGSIGTGSDLVLARAGGRAGYVLVGEVSAWLAAGLVLCALALAVTRRRKYRFLAAIGALVDVAGITYACSLRF